ncbi:MAG: hypothetical protein BWY79_00568 [Actinobacteria bacterium ADurb.Bin444]|nr:MAG: hypothetical protein BWY79_00568 [Actinobacteria bacterium ADurb.Bin444]
MSGKMLVVTIILFFHDLFTVVWVGGMIALGLGIMPALRRSLGTGPQTQRIVGVFQSGFRWVSYACIIGLVVTGVLLSRRNPEFQGFFAWGNAYSAFLSLKHILVVAMVLIVMVRATALAPRVPHGTTGPVGPQGAPAQLQGKVAGPDPTPLRPTLRNRLSMLLLFVNIGLGVAVLFLSAATTMLGIS